ncbi:serine/threonine protein phosphatase 1 [Limimaricola soesokkakensis]|uniref:Diadenosine tetraphosphatase n=1 Tax=Limimaricola soesokkakensis TaxID=1343159 RepID=A0A1X6ZRX8_9RHOB|nr:metallophosphoesterase [Limimaricola soesokkakensis]PSK84048.1 serine/threonine protein phosphatase 1 [Limimaricola soesokkakensis]SLN59829.1 diadenosine tetraphosphatase [Limimaricola soesokkakensis]
MLITDWASNFGPSFETQTFAIGDVHGQAGALERLLDHIDSIPRVGQREIILLGDLCDRGAESLRCFELAWNASSRADECHILPGNHEIMMLKAIDDPKEVYWWKIIGGSKTLQCIGSQDEMGDEARLAALRAAFPDGLEDTLRHGATHLIREGVLFVHAGLHPEMNADEFLEQDRFARDKLDRHWAWIRQPFLSWQGGWEHHGLHMVVHGHSPATTRPLLSVEEASTVLEVAGKHRAICVDVGAMKMPQIAAVEFLGTQHRLHVAAAPADWVDDPFADWRKPLGDTVDIR